MALEQAEDEVKKTSERGERAKERKEREREASVFCVYSIVDSFDGSRRGDEKVAPSLMVL